MYCAHRVVRSARTVAIVRPQATRKLATAPPPPPPLPTGPKVSGAPPPLPPSEPKASKAPWIITGLAVLGGAGYYYARTTGQDEDIEKKARELEHATRVKAGKAVDEGKAKVADVKAAGKAQATAAESRIQQTYDSAASAVSSAAHDSKARLDAAAASTRASIDQTRDKAAGQLYSAERKTEETKEAAKSSWWSWFGWGKAKGQEAKSEVALGAEKAAGEVRKGAEDAQNAAAKRT